MTTPTPPPDNSKDGDRPWAVRSIPAEVRDAAVAAAQRQRMTVGEWLSIAIRREIALERRSSTLTEMNGFAAPALEGEVLSPSVPAVRDETGCGLKWQRFSLDEWKDYLEVIKRVGEFSPDGKPSPALLKKLDKRLRDIL